MIEDAVGSGKPPDIMVFPEAVLWLAMFGNGTTPSVNWTEARRSGRFKTWDGVVHYSRTTCDMSAKPWNSTVKTFYPLVRYRLVLL